MPEREIDYTVERKISFALRSSDANKLNDSSYDLDYTLRPIHIPIHARNVHLTLDYAQIPHRFYNINLTNNKIVVNGPDSSDVVGDFTITFPVGIYNHEELSLFLERDLTEQDAKTTAGPLFSLEHFIPDNTTASIINYTNVDIQWSDANSTMAAILGYDAVDSGTSAIVPAIDYSDNEHGLKHIDSYYLNTNIIRGLRINDAYHNCIGIVPINVAAGETIYHNPNNVQSLTADNLINQEINHIRFWITSDGTTVVDLNDDDYEFAITIYYTEPHNHEWDERTNQV